MDFAQVAKVLSDPSLRSLSPTDRELFLGELQQLMHVLDEQHIDLPERESDGTELNKTSQVLKYLAQWTRHVTETGVTERRSVAHFVAWLKQLHAPLTGLKRARDDEARNDEEDDEDWARQHADLTRVKRPRVTTAAPVQSASAVEASEKRLSRYRSAPSKALLERIDLARQQRHCLVQHVTEGLEHCYHVLAQGTVYTVKIGHIPTCNCANASRGIHCTHLLFVLLKVLRVPANDPVLYQRSLLTCELHKIYEPQTSSAHCVICYEPARDSSEALVDAHAQSRGCVVHEPCLVKYRQARADLALALLCPHCAAAL